MPKNIVICFDGTSNQFSENNTNVIKLYQLIKKEPGIQEAYYHPGVGTIGPGWSAVALSKLIQLFCQATGAGVTQDVKDAYKYLMDYYEDGDQLFIFGFSRGAYTARCLTGMLNSVGLLEKGLTESIDYAFQIYAVEKTRPLAMGFQKTFSRSCPIHFLGVFDTVGALAGQHFTKYFTIVAALLLGYQVYPDLLLHIARLVSSTFTDTITIKTRLVGALLFGFATFLFRAPLEKFVNKNILGAHKFFDTRLNTQIKNGFHALSIDDQRRNFRPTLWDTSELTPGQTVEQVWFAGVHVDIGGFNISQNVSDISLQWMLEHAISSGLILVDDFKNYLSPDPVGKLSENAWWWKITIPTWRQIPKKSKIHWSVEKRLSASNDYRPKNLIAGSYEFTKEKTFGPSMLTKAPEENPASV